MKKLAILLCACAVAVAGLMVSCKNEPTEYVNVTSKAEKVFYTVSGTWTGTQIYGAKDAPTTDEMVTTYDNAYAWTYKYESKQSTKNYTNWSIFIYDEDASSTMSTTTGDTTDKGKSWDEDYMPLNLYKINGAYYLYDTGDSEYMKVTVTGTVGGKEFKISAEQSDDDTRTDMTQAEKDDTSEVNKASSKMELTFTKIN